MSVNSAQLSLLSLLISSTYALFTFLITLFFVGPYRSALFKILRLNRVHKTEQKVSVLVVNSEVSFF